MLKKSLSMFLLFLFCSVTLIYGQQDKETNPPVVPILGTQLQKLHSEIVGQDYDLYVNLPRNYSDTTKNFPVLYVLDGQWDFALAESLFGQQYYDGFVPEIIVVGITWGGENPNYDVLRARDFTPTKTMQNPQSGNAPKFLEFIEKELIPFMESKYRVSKTDRALMGSSLGGLFTLYTLFHKTSLFDRYILTSPALQWDNDITYKYEKEFSEKNSSLPVRIYMAYGQYEPGPMFQKFIDVFKSRNYKGLAFKSDMIENMGHSGTKAYGYSKGLQFAYLRPSINLDDAVLEKYSGNYEIMKGINVKLTVEDHQLVAYAPGSPKLILEAETDKDFYYKGAYLFLHFKKDDAGNVTGCTLSQFTGENFLKKVN